MYKTFSKIIVFPQITNITPPHILLQLRTNFANKWSENLECYFRFSLVENSYIITGQLITFLTTKILRI